MTEYRDQIMGEGRAYRRLGLDADKCPPYAVPEWSAWWREGWDIEDREIMERVADEKRKADEAAAAANAAPASRVLVTGGAGYLGSVLVRRLLSADMIANHYVTVLDNFRHRENSLAHLCCDGRLEIVNGDCRDTRILDDLVPAHNVIIPLAALVGAPLCDSDRVGAHSINQEAVALIVNQLRPEQRIIIPTTNSGYGIGQQGVACTEESPLEPVSFYGKVKVEAEKFVIGAGGISLRLATLFGMSPRMRLDLLVNDFVHRAVRDRSVVLYEAGAKRNYLHVRDAARAFAHAIENWDAMKGQVYNVGLSSANLSKRELASKIKEHVPSFTVLEAPVGEDPDKRDYVVSNAKIEATGWKPRYTLDDGIKELIKGYQMVRNERYGNV